MGKVQQLKVPGTERQSIPELDEAANAYVEVRDKRMELKKQETQLKKNLLELALERQDELPEVMKSGRPVRIYRFEADADTMELRLEKGKDKVRVFRWKEDAEEEAE